MTTKKRKSYKGFMDKYKLKELKSISGVIDFPQLIIYEPYDYEIPVRITIEEINQLTTKKRGR